MSQLLAIASAALFGIADFAGGRASRELSVWRVTAWSMIIGVPLLAFGVIVVPAPDVQLSDIIFGAVAGFVGLIGLALLYSALAAGAMSLVAPIIGTVAAVIPVMWDVAMGTSITPVNWIGVALGITAVVLIAGERSGEHLTPKLLVQALGAAIAFAIFYIALAQTSSESGLWPLVAARSVAIPLALGVALVAGSAGIPQKGPRRFVFVAGLFDMLANFAILISLQTGPMGINVVLTSLYPVFTVAAAILILREHPTVRQSAGIGLAITAVAFLAL
ncbi:MAG: DMT family transporter [Actinomycetia bacterium]|nr:DMT family transporter [Actinomycetes bacterium]